jgi:hypothetical protein
MTTTKRPRGRAVPIYRPGVNRAEEVQIPACDLDAGGRTLRYVGRSAPVDAGGVFIVLSRWRADDGLTMFASLDPLPHQHITSKPRFLHLSVSRPDRYPAWDEMVAAVEALAGPDLDMAMIKPRRADYVSPHPNCFHWWELPTEWGIL